MFRRLLVCRWFGHDWLYLYSHRKCRRCGQMEPVEFPNYGKEAR